MNRPQRDAEDSDLFQQILWGMDRGAFDDRLGESLIRAWQFGVQDRVVQGLIKDKLRPLQKRDALGELPPFKATRLAKGELLLGQGIYKEHIRIPLQWLVAGMLVVSNTGGGKSNLISFLLVQVAAHGCSVWLSESYKQQLRHLRAPFRRLGIELVILRPKDWRWNLLQSHLSDPRRHLCTALDLLVRVLDLETPRARSILTQLADGLYEKFGIWSGQASRWPTLFDLYEVVWSATGLNTAAREAILDRLGSLLVALTPRCAAYRAAWNPVELARFSINFEMGGASELVKQLLLESCLLTVFQREVERGVLNGPLKLVIAFDDSQRLFEASHHSGGGQISPLDELAGIIRGTGISLWAILQTMHGFSKRLLPNLATKIIGRLGSHDDYASLGADLAMAPEQIVWARLHLQPGSFIGQVAEGSYREPFIFTVPLIPFPDRIDDAEAADSVTALSSLPVVFADEFARWQPHHTVEVSGGKKPTLTDTELRFLKAIVAKPDQASSTYNKALGLSGQQAARIRERLVRDGLVREHRVATNARGRTSIVLEPLAAALVLTGGAS